MALKLTSTLFAVAAAAVLAGCASKQAATPLNDGELALPADYKSWSKFLSEVQRPDAKQVREIYMNSTATKGTAAAGFPMGSVFVMENYSVKANADGSLQKDANGKLVKDKLVAVFVQGKGEGWGTKAIPELRNGNWIYSAYTPTGEKGPQDTNTCRACHVPLVNKDFVHRYDEYFSKKTSGLSHPAVVAALTASTTLSQADLGQVQALSR